MILSTIQQQILEAAAEGWARVDADPEAAAKGPTKKPARKPRRVKS